MYDVVSLLKTYIDDNWAESDPEKADLKYSFDEFNPNDPKIQILFEEMPIEHVWITKTYYKVVHPIKISIYVRPIRYDSTTITSSKNTFRYMKAEIDRILRVGRYSISNIKKAELGKWEDKPILVGRDFKLNQKEPIVFVSSQIVKCSYFEGEFT